MIGIVYLQYNTLLLEAGYVFRQLRKLFFYLGGGLPFGQDVLGHCELQQPRGRQPYVICTCVAPCFNEYLGVRNVVF